jgi:AraC family transcriptional regulator, arabinose operon regulatory protein
MDKTSIESMLTVLARGNIRYFSPPPSPGDIKDVSSTFERYKGGKVYYQPQYHDTPELIFGLGGKLEVFINGKWLKFQPGDLWVFLPGAVHTERYIRPNIPYQMLWTAISAGRIGFHITAYKPGRGYHLASKRVAWQVSVRQDLCELAARPEIGDDKLLQIHFQTMLMDALYQMIPYMDKASAKSNNPKFKVPFHRHIIEQIRHHLDHQYATEVSLPELAAMVHYSPCHLNLLFRQQIGIPIRQYLLKARLTKAEKLLKNTDMEIKQIAYSVGFKDPLYFSRLFRRFYGVSPSGYHS